MVFSLSALWWRRIRGLWMLPDGRDWLRGKLGIVLMGRAMLSKSLIQFSVDGWGCVPSLLLDLRPNYQFSSVVSDSLWPHESQHAGPPHPSQNPRVYSNSCPPSRWCHPAILSSVVPFSFCPQSLQASGSFPMSQLFTWGGQSIRVSVSASVLPMNTQDLPPSEWTGQISLQSKRISRVFCNTTVLKHQFFSIQLSSQSNSRIHTWPLEKP